MRRTLLLLLAFGTTSFVSSENLISYNPASGYYRCPEEDMVCNVKGCEKEDKCSVIVQGFRKTSLKDGTDVYKAMAPNSALSITGGEGTTLACDVACECQLITSKLGCNIQISKPSEERIIEPIQDLVDESGQQYTATNQLEEEESSTAAASSFVAFRSGRAFVLACVMSIFLVN